MLKEHKQYKFTKNGNSFVGTPLDIVENQATVQVDKILSGEITSEQVNDEFVEKKEDQVVKVGDFALFNVGDWGWRVDVYDDQPQAAAGGARKRRRSSKRRSNKRRSNKRKSYRRRRN